MSGLDKDPMKEYIQAAISYEAQNIRKTPQYAALPDTNIKAEEKRKRRETIKKLKIEEDTEKDNDEKISIMPSENYGSDMKMSSSSMVIESTFNKKSGLL